MNGLMREGRREPVLYSKYDQNPNSCNCFNVVPERSIGIIVAVALFNDKAIDVVARVLAHPALRVGDGFDAPEVAVIGHGHSIRRCVDDGGVALVAVAVWGVEGGALALLCVFFS